MNKPCLMRSPEHWPPCLCLPVPAGLTGSLCTPPAGPCLCCLPNPETGQVLHAPVPRLLRPADETAFPGSLGSGRPSRCKGQGNTPFSWSSLPYSSVLNSLTCSLLLPFSPSPCPRWTLPPMPTFSLHHLFQGWLLHPQVLCHPCLFFHGFISAYMTVHTAAILNPLIWILPFLNSPLLFPFTTAFLKGSLHSLL